MSDTATRCQHPCHPPFTDGPCHLRNCNHFASDLCERLTGNAAPEWVNRLAWMGEKAKFLLPQGFDTPMAAPVTEAQARAEREAEELLGSPHPHELDANFVRDDAKDPDRST